jgi:hypothetical protein
LIQLFIEHCTWLPVRVDKKHLLHDI